MLQAPAVLQKLHRGVRQQTALLRHPESARGRVLAGLIDAGMSSLAGLGAGVYAAHFLSPALLGAYSIYFVAFLIGGFVPVMLYLVPARVAALDMQMGDRLALMRPSLARGALVSGAAAALTPFAGLVALGSLTVRDIAPLAITAAAFVLLSPLQDHVRAMFHLAGRPWAAVWVSAARLAVVVGTMLVLHSLAIERQWVPFGSLALGCGVSLMAGLWLARAGRGHFDPVMEPMASLFKSGWPLLIATMLPLAAQFIAGGLVANFTTIDNLGYAEASRQIAQPIHVVALGLGQALTPLLMQAAQARSLRAIRRPRRLYLLGLVACTALYAPLVAFPHALNPFGALLPNAYHIEALVLVSVAAVFVTDLSAVPATELAASRSGLLLLAPAFVASLLQLVFIAVTMQELGAYALPLGIALNGTVVTLWLFRRSNRLLLADGVHDGSRG